MNVKNTLFNTLLGSLVLSFAFMLLAFAVQPMGVSDFALGFGGMTGSLFFFSLLGGIVPRVGLVLVKYLHHG